MLASPVRAQAHNGDRLRAGGAMRGVPAGGCYASAQEMNSVPALRLLRVSLKAIQPVAIKHVRLKASWTP